MVWGTLPRVLLGKRIQLKPKIAIPLLIIMLLVSFAYLWENPQHIERNPEDANSKEYTRNPIYVTLAVVTAILGYVMASKSSNKGFNGQYT